MKCLLTMVESINLMILSLTLFLSMLYTGNIYLILMKCLNEIQHPNITNVHMFIKTFLVKPICWFQIGFYFSNLQNIHRLSSLFYYYYNITNTITNEENRRVHNCGWIWYHIYSIFYTKGSSKKKGFVHYQIEVCFQL